MKRLVIVALIAASAAGAQEPTAPRREWQISYGLGAGRGGVSLGTDGSSAPVTTHSGRLQIGWAADDRTMLGIDLFASSLGASSSGVVPATDNAVMAASFYLQVYPRKRGGFFEVGAGFAQMNADAARFGNYAGQSTGHGIALRYGMGYDFRVSTSWSVTAYATGLMVMRAPWRDDSQDCCSYTTTAALPPSPAPAASAPLRGPTMSGMNIVSIGLAVTYAEHAASPGKR